MPLATCWCVYVLPPAVVGASEAAFRAEVARCYPELARDDVWQPGVRHATALWTMNMTTMLLPAVASSDRPMHPDRPGLASVRQVLRYRWRHLVDLLGAGGELPVLAKALPAPDSDLGRLRPS